MVAEKVNYYGIHVDKFKCSTRSSTDEEHAIGMAFARNLIEPMERYFA